MHYIIDGYNLFFFLFGNSFRDFKSQRQSLIQSMNAKIEFLSLDVSLVFDSHLVPGEGSRSHYHHLEIQFTPEGMNADDFIINYLKQSRNTSKEVLVTNDRELSQRARHLSAGTQSIDQFLNWLNKRYSNKKRGKDKPVAKFNTSLEIDILSTLFSAPPSPPPSKPLQSLTQLPALPAITPKPSVRAKLIRDPIEKPAPVVPHVEKAPGQIEGSFEYYLSTFQASHEAILDTERAAKIAKKLKKKQRGSK